MPIGVFLTFTLKHKRCSAHDKAVEDCNNEQNDILGVLKYIQKM